MAARRKENRAADLTFFALVTIIIQRVKRMKQKSDQLKKLLIFNALILVLSIVITITLLATGGRAVTPQATPAATQAVS